jgi:hypothetical protein
VFHRLPKAEVDRQRYRRQQLGSAQAFPEARGVGVRCTSPFCAGDAVVGNNAAAQGMSIPVAISIV